VAPANRWFLALAWFPLVVGLLAACGDESPGETPTPNADTAPAGSALGPGITIADAVASKLEGPLLVNGWLWRPPTGEIRLCTTLSETTPPGCGKPSLAVVGLDLDSLPNLRSERGTTTSSKPTQVLGTVAGGVLTVAWNATG
jgi:hypothetical protein